jgi:hypothetical protein
MDTTQRSHENFKGFAITSILISPVIAIILAVVLLLNLVAGISGNDVPNRGNAYAIFIIYIVAWLGTCCGIIGLKSQHKNIALVGTILSIVVFLSSMLLLIFTDYGFYVL